METVLNRDGQAVTVMTAAEQIIASDDLFAPTRAQCAAAIAVRAYGSEAVLSFEDEVRTAAQGLPTTHAR